MKFYQIDAFSETPFSGNPAAVCMVQEKIPDHIMQKIAMENNLSETAFVKQLEGTSYALRWFTPEREIDLCGHATLASAHALRLEKRVSEQDTITFSTRSGNLFVSFEKGKIVMDFPRTDPIPVRHNKELNAVLGIDPLFTGNAKKWLFVEIAEEAEVRNLSPDFKRLARIGEGAFIVTAASSSSDIDFVSRVFVPGYGIDEDPVTGSAHCLLAPYWAAKLNKTTVTGFQASKRGGYMECTLKGSDRVLLKGRAVTIIEGELLWRS